MRQKKPPIPVHQIPDKWTPAYATSLVPAQGTMYPGQTPSASRYMNIDVRDAVSKLIAPPRASLYWTNYQPGALPPNSDMIRVITPDAILMVTDDMWTPEDPTRIWINTPGLYKVRIYVRYPYHPAFTTYHCGVNLNGASVWGAGGGRLIEDTRIGSTASGFGTAMCAVGLFFFNAGDYIEAFTGTDNTNNTVPFSSMNDSRFSAALVASN